MGGHGGSNVVAGDTHDEGNKAIRGNKKGYEDADGRGEERR